MPPSFRSRRFAPDPLASPPRFLDTLRVASAVGLLVVAPVAAGCTEDSGGAADGVENGEVGSSEPTGALSVGAGSTSDASSTDATGTGATSSSGGGSDAGAQGPSTSSGEGASSGDGGSSAEGSGGASTGGGSSAEGSGGASSGGGPGSGGASSSSASSGAGGACATDCFETGCAAGLTCVGDPGCGACSCGLPTPVAPLDAMRSLYVTDTEILARFDLERVLQALLDSAGSTQTPTELYRQWWDLNADDASGVGDGPHCSGTLNGYPQECPRDEGVLAGSDPFAPTPLYTTVGVVNRVDKMPTDGSNCGQYRVSFNLERRIDGLPDPDFNYFIVEAVLPNPRPDLGTAGCMPVVKLWYDLSTTADASARADALERLYFDGIEGFAPVLRWEHLAGASEGSGQIRANQFLHSVSGQMWQLREYAMGRSCAGAGCTLAVRMDTVKDNPFGLLFRTPGSAEAPAQAAAFQEWFVTRVESLATATDVNDLALPTPEVWNAGESTEPGFLGQEARDFWNDYGLQSEANPALLAAIQAELARIGSPLTPRNVVDRATATSCAGCHQIVTMKDLGGGMTHPDSLKFVHTDDNRDLSPALRDSFLPRRQTTMTAYLNQHCSPQQVAMQSAPAPFRTERFARSIGGGYALGH